MSQSKARANEVKKMPTTNDTVLFRTPAISTWTRKARRGNESIWTVTRSKEKSQS